MGADTPEITIGTVQGGLYVGLQGRATQRTCPTADKIVNDFLASKPENHSVTLDLTGCEWVDSTCAGWFVSLTKRVSRFTDGRIVLTGCSARCRASIEKMSLASLFEFMDPISPDESETVRCTTSDQPKKEELKLMLEAHEALAAVNPENARVFAPIAAALRTQIEHK